MIGSILLRRSRHRCKPGLVLVLALLMVTSPVCLPSAAGHGLELLSMRMPAYQARKRRSSVDVSDTRIHAIRRRRGRRRPFEIR
jgi:hypothetical protein